MALIDPREILLTGHARCLMFSSPWCSPFSVWAHTPRPLPWGFILSPSGPDPPGSGLGPVGEGGAPPAVVEQPPSPTGPSLLGPVLADGERMNPHLSTNINGSRSCTSRLGAVGLGPRRERQSSAVCHCRGWYACIHRFAGRGSSNGRSDSAVGPRALILTSYAAGLPVRI